MKHSLSGGGTKVAQNEPEGRLHFLGLTGLSVVQCFIVHGLELCHHTVIWMCLASFFLFCFCSRGCFYVIFPSSGQTIDNADQGVVLKIEFMATQNNCGAKTSPIASVGF